MALTTSKTVYRQTFGPLMAGVVTAPYPNCLHCKARQAAGGMGYEVRASTRAPLGSRGKSAARHVRVI
jgi:4-aminobutyrate aminotransferase